MLAYLYLVLNKFLVSRMPTENKKDVTYRVFVEALGHIVGKSSYVYRDIRRALNSEAQLDLYLAEDAFNSLPKETKFEIQYLVKKIASDVHTGSPS